MGKSSIHIQKASGGAITHNSRENYSKSVVFVDEKNELWNDKKQAYEIYRSELKNRIEAYTKRTNQKLQKTAVTHLSAVVNLEQHHTIKDLEKIKDELEKVFDTKVFQIAIHKDEGKLKHKETGEYLVSGIDFFLNSKDNNLYYDYKFTKPLKLQDYEIEKNYHAHIEMMGLDSQGQAIRQKMNRFVLSNLQDFTAETLQMERGNNYQIKKSVKRLDTHDFKASKKRENEVKKIVKDKQNKIIKIANEKIEQSKEEKKKLKEDLEELKKENSKFRAELKELKAEREVYKKQEDLNKQLQEDLKANKIELSEAKEQIEELKKEIFNHIKENKTLKNTLEEKEIEHREELDHYGYRVKLAEIKILKNQLNSKDKTIEERNKTIEESNKTIEDLKNKVLNLQKKIDLMYQNSNQKKQETQNNHQGISLSR